MGQSSGSGSVSTHLVAPPSFGLFKTAGMLSGPFGTWISSPMVAEPPLDPAVGAQATFDALLKETNCKVNPADSEAPSILSGEEAAGGRSVDEMAVDCLEELSAQTLATLNTTRQASFGPVVDGVELTDWPQRLMMAGTVDPSLSAVLLGSVSEDAGVALAHNATAANYTAALLADSATYPIGPFLNSTPAAIATMLRLCKKTHDSLRLAQFRRP